MLNKCMEMYGNVWKCMEMYGNVWKCMEMYGNVWKCMQMYGNAWKCMDMCGNGLLLNGTGRSCPLPALPTDANSPTRQLASVGHPVAANGR